MSSISLFLSYTQTVVNSDGIAVWLCYLTATTLILRFAQKDVPYPENAIG